MFTHVWNYKVNILDLYIQTWTATMTVHYNNCCSAMGWKPCGTNGLLTLGLVHTQGCNRTDNGSS